MCVTISDYVGKTAATKCLIAQAVRTNPGVRIFSRKKHPPSETAEQRAKHRLPHAYREDFQALRQAEAANDTKRRSELIRAWKVA